MKAARVVLVFAALVAAASAASTNFTAYFTGGLPFCSQCGTQGQYACSPDTNGQTIGNWNDGVISFADPIPAGGMPNSVSVKVYGTWSCDPATDDSMFGLALNDMVFAVREAEKGTSDCKCNTCDNTETLTFSFRNGLPNYNRGGAYNRLRFIMYRNSVCLNRVEVTINYDTSGTELPHVYKQLPLPQGTGCSICNAGTNQWCSTSTNNTLNLEFTDPLPTGSLLVGIDVHFSYNFAQKSSGYQTQLASSLMGTAIYTSTMSDSAFSNMCGCYGDSTHLSTFYQRGWPGYVKGGKNTLKLEVKKYISTAGNMCFGRVGVDLIYYYVDKNGEATLQRMPAVAAAQGRELI